MGVRERGLALIFPAVFLIGCATIEPRQDGHNTRLIAGSLADDKRWISTDRTAHFFAQYAVLATLAYDDKLYGLKNTGHSANLEGCEYPEHCQSINQKLAMIREVWGDKPILQRINDCSIPAKDGGRRDFDHLGKPGQCGVDIPSRHRVLDGMGIQVWVRKADRCGEMVVAFRGTDFHQSDDWLSNLRWVTRVLPIHDQYEQAREHVDRMIDDAIAKLGCTPKRITAVGHSLGGGLAQHAAYSQMPGKRVGISRVYAFDPSFVTGYGDRAIQGERLERTTKRLKIDRIYEHGEILAYPRLFLRLIVPPQACSPQIRLIRFNLITGDVRLQHSMRLLARGLVQRSGNRLSRGYLDDSLAVPSAPEADPKTGECLDLAPPV